MGPGVRSTTTEAIALRASARAPNGMPTSWATPSETDAAATPAIIRALDGATAIELRGRLVRRHAGHLGFRRVGADRVHTAGRFGQAACSMAVATASPRPITAGAMSAALSDART